VTRFQCLLKRCGSTCGGAGGLHSLGGKSIALTQRPQDVAAAHLHAAAYPVKCLRCTVLYSRRVSHHSVWGRDNECQQSYCGGKGMKLICTLTACQQSGFIMYKCCANTGCKGKNSTYASSLFDV
jgi:hypothetical protein